MTEVVRDLYRSDAQPEQSYSERQLYESALDRVVREISAVNKITDTESLKLIEQSLAKSPRRAAKGEVDAEAEAEATLRKRRPKRAVRPLTFKGPVSMPGLFSFRRACFCGDSRLSERIFAVSS